MKRYLWVVLGAVAAMAGCDSGTSAVETRDRSEDAPAAVDARADAAASEAEPAAAPGPVTANRRETVDEKVQRQFARNGAAFAARTPEEFVAKMRAFVANPPAGTETVKRPNGDTLFYQASTNTFAVADRSGTPRTMFKPDEGAAYWAEQKERAPTFGQRRNRSVSDEG